MLLGRRQATLLEASNWAVGVLKAEPDIATGPAQDRRQYASRQGADQDFSFSLFDFILMTGWVRTEVHLKERSLVSMAEAPQTMTR